MSSKKFIKCDEANITCDKSQYNEASLLEKIKLNIHLIWCAACRKYSRNNAKLTKLVSQKEDKLNASEKNKIKATLDKELQKQNN
jgi:hypothetical protein